MNNKKLIIFGYSITPLLVIIGTIIYSSSSKNNVHQNQQNNLQFQEEKKEINPNIDKVKNKKNKIKKKKKKKKKVNIQTGEEYIPCLDNYKMQIGLWFVYLLFFIYFLLSFSVKTEEFFNDVNSGRRKLITFDGYFLKTKFPILITIFFIIGEIATSFIVYLPACWINKKPWKKAFSVYHRFWWQSWTNVLWTIIIFIVFGFIDFTFLAYLLKYSMGFIIRFINSFKKKTLP